MVVRKTWRWRKEESVRLWEMLGLDGGIVRRMRTAAMASFRTVNNNNNNNNTKERSKDKTDGRIRCLLGFTLVD